MRLKHVCLVAVLAMAAVALAVPGLVGAQSNQTGLLKANMTGNQIVNPNGGAPSGRGKVKLQVNAPKGKVCFRLRFSGIGQRATESTIHKGNKGSVGPDVVTLFTDSSKRSGFHKCVKGLSQSLLQAILTNPSQYYTDIDTTQYPNGAVRGQLKQQGT
jgi:hypothetical protein